MKPSLIHTFAHIKGLRRHGIMLVRPAREWAFGLLLGLMLLAAGAVHATLMFDSANARAVEEGVTPEAAQTVSYRREEVHKTLELYEARATAFEQLRGTARSSSASSKMSIEDDEVLEPIDATPVAQ